MGTALRRISFHPLLRRTDVRVNKFLFRVAFANVTSLRERAYMVSDWRAIIANYEVRSCLIATG